MKKIIVCFLLSAVVLPTSFAHAQSDNGTPPPPRGQSVLVAMVRDLCVKQGIVKDDGPTAEKTLRDYAEPQLAKTSMPLNRQQAIDNFNKILENAKAQAAQQHLDKTKCYTAVSQWHYVKKTMGTQ